jgi:hypothetical protein
VEVLVLRLGDPQRLQVALGGTVLVAEQARGDRVHQQQVQAEGQCTSRLEHGEPVLGLGDRGGKVTDVLRSHPGHPAGLGPDHRIGRGLGDGAGFGQVLGTVIEIAGP